MINIDMNAPSFETVFFEEIEVLVQKTNNSYIDAILHWCDMRKIEVEYVAGFVENNLALRAKLQSEAENLHFLRRTARLPI